MTTTTDRPQLIRRGNHLAWATICWNSTEGVVAITSGLVAGSVALIGFGIDSYVEAFAVTERGGLEHWRAEEVEDCC